MEMSSIDPENLNPIAQFGFSKIILMDDDGVNTDPMGIQINGTWYILSTENYRTFANMMLAALDREIES